MAEETKPVRATETTKPARGKRATDAAAGTSISVTFSDVTFVKPSLQSIRDTYENQDASRFLGSFIAAPVVDLLASYVSKPRIVADDRTAQPHLDNIMEANEAAMSEVQRLAIRDGSAYLRITYELPPEGSRLYAARELGRIVLTPLPCDRVKVARNVMTGEIEQAVISDAVAWYEGSIERSATVETVITADNENVRLASGYLHTPPGIILGDKPNPSGLVPIVEFFNDYNPATGKGVSEIERLDPLIRQYHDVASHAIKGSKLHSVPKLHLGVADKRRFVDDNGGSSATRKLNLSGSDSIMTEPEDVVEFVEASNPIGATMDLLHTLFYCMVQTSQTPEFILGVHMSSSYASTAEQTPVWQMKVQRKQQMFIGAWWRAARMMLAKLAFHEGLELESFNCKVYFETPDTRDKKSVAEQQELTVRSVVQAVREKLMSWEAGVQALSRVFPTMREFDDEDGAGEKAAILSGANELAALEQPANTSQALDVDGAINAVQKLLKSGA